MKRTILFLAAATILSAAFAASQSLYAFKVKSIDGKTLSLSKYKRKVLLIVNVASLCGNTPQYAGLEKLYKGYKKEGLVILGFPCNQFKSQEPGTNKEIKTFCESKYGVTFPLFSKIEVNGDKADPLYDFLKKGEDIHWNFTKFLVGRDGVPLKRFEPKVQPATLVPDIEKALGQRP